MTSRVSQIALRGVRAFGRHGVDPGEKDHLQPFDLDLELDVDLEKARVSDALGDTVDYAALHRRVLEIVATTSFALLERLGQCVLDEVLRDHRVVAARVTVAKPGLLAGATPAVTVTASRRDQ
jgi:7,8-dihydroneopterin aldolase/epimerase/oxygenase